MEKTKKKRFEVLDENQAQQLVTNSYKASQNKIDALRKENRIAIYFKDHKNKTALSWLKPNGKNNYINDSSIYSPPIEEIEVKNEEIVT